MKDYEVMELVREFQARQRDQWAAALTLDEANKALAKARDELSQAMTARIGGIVAPGLGGGTVFYHLDYEDGEFTEWAVGQVLK